MKLKESAVIDMDRSAAALALEVPASVHANVVEIWQAVREHLVPPGPVRGHQDTKRRHKVKFLRLIKVIVAAIVLAVTPLAETAHATVTCSTVMRLYDGSYYTGDALVISTRWLYQNLSRYGWDNRVSSVQVGGCAVELYTGTNGSGSILYLPAWHSIPSMPIGFNNSVSSIYIF